VAQECADRVALSVGPDGIVGVAYEDDGVVYYALLAGGDFDPTPLGPGRHPSLAQGRAGIAHIAWQGDGTLEYATDYGGDWIITAIDVLPSALEGYVPALALDEADHIHVVHGATGSLLHTLSASVGWTTDTIASWSGRAFAISTAMSPTSLEVAYVDEGDVLRYASNSTGEWIAGQMEPRLDGGSGVSLALDQSAHPLVAHAGGCRTGDCDYFLQLARPAGLEWEDVTLDSQEGRAWPSIAVSSTGSIHIVYLDSVLGDLRYGTDETGAWTFAVIDADDDTGYSASVAMGLDSSSVHVAYIDATSSMVMYAHRIVSDGIDTNCDGVPW
jgi:hypothetical protein